MSVRIVVVQGPEQGKSFEIVKDRPYTIGRGEEANIQIVDDLVSRIHLLVNFDGQRLTIIDQGSTNKTFVGRNPLPPQQPISLASDTRFSLGPEVFLEVQFGESQSSPPQVQSQTPIAPPPVSQNPFAASIIQNPPVRPRPAAPPQESNRPAPPSTPATAGNFSGSIRPDAQLDHAVSDESSNIFGAYSKNPGIMENSPKNQPKPPARPDPTPKPRPPEPSRQDAGYLGNSIAPPGEIGVNISRPSFDAEDDMFPAHGQNTPPPIAPDSPNVLPETTTREVKTDPPPPIQHNNSFATDSIAAPGQQAGGHLPSRAPITPIAPATSEQQNAGSGGFAESIQTRPRTEAKTDPVAPPPPQADDAFVASAPAGSNFAGSIALPGSSSQESQIMSPGDYQSSIAMPGDVHVRRQPEAKPVRQTPMPLTSSTFTSLVWLNGLHAMTGQKPGDSIADLFEKLRSQFAIVVCIDWSKIPPPETTDGNALESSIPSSGGIPIFNDPNGASLVPGDSFQLDLNQLWNQDAIVVFAGHDADKMMSFLSQLSKVNIQTGEVADDQFFGFCWPSVLKAVLAGQKKDVVDRIFDQVISGIALEDPDQECGWSMISQTELVTAIS